MKSPVILFDLDGTLIDSTEAILESFGEAFGAHALPCPEAAVITKMIGMPLREMFLRLGVDNERADAFVAAYKAHYRKISREKTVLLPGAKEAVETAAEFARLGIVTTKTGRYSIDLLEHLELMHFFETLVGSEDVRRHKPHPEPVFKALERMGVSTKSVWLIGDTPMDVEAALAAGVNPFAVTCGYGQCEAFATRCRHIAPDAKTAVANIRSKSLL
ncbi:HAD family hydrolase [Hydrogenimonas urashimensis]|uniref:HAD family hydrolase n=1 Tax=Hydrogenimonas urashimensis TaxID=2740515 RepID=UPI001915F4BD|nr:HAD family hydrolase [Hydrogenimonas urashimensis]